MKVTNSTQTYLFNFYGSQNKVNFIQLGWRYIENKGLIKNCVGLTGVSFSFDFLHWPSVIHKRDFYENLCKMICTRACYDKKMNGDVYRKLKTGLRIVYCGKSNILEVPQLQHNNNINNKKTEAMTSMTQRNVSYILCKKFSFYP